MNDLKKWNVLLCVSYDIEAESEKEAVEKAKDRFDTEIVHSGIDPSEVITTIDPVEGEGVVPHEVP